MKRLHLAVGVALALTRCNGLALPAELSPSPAVVADRTVVDEQAVLAVELAYAGARLAVETLVDVGQTTGPRAAQVRPPNLAAFRAVEAGKAAYDAGNATSYTAAVIQARAAVAQLLALANKGN